MFKKIIFNLWFVKKEIAELNDKIKKQEEEIKAVGGMLSYKNKQRDNLIEKQCILEKGKNDLLMEMGELAIANEKLEKSLLELSAEITGARGTINEQSSTIEGLNMEADKLRQDYDSLKSAPVKDTEYTTELKRRNSNQAREIERLNRELNSCKPVSR